jgi:hypothetical protein
MRRDSMWQRALATGLSSAQVKAAQLDGAGHAQHVAQAAHGDLFAVVDGETMGAPSGRSSGNVAL